MGAKKKYSTRLIRNNHEFTESQGSITEYDDYVLAVLSEGLNFEAIDNLLAKLRIDSCAKSTFYKHQAKLAPYLIEAAIESCRRARNRMNLETCISMDGSWSSRRHAQHCFVSLCDVMSKKVVDFTVVSRTSQFFMPQYSGASQAMEMAGFEDLVKKWTSNYSYPKIKKFVHDNDVKALLIIKKYNWMLEDFLDPNHVFKNIMKSFDLLNEKNFKSFGEIRESFELFLKFLFSNSSLTKEDRLNQYDNMYNHYIGQHRQCIHNDSNPVSIWNGKHEYAKDLLLFLKKHRNLIEKINPDYRTQINECLNSIKAQKASKTYSYKQSFALRCCIAVLQTNDPGTWYYELRNRIGLRPLPMKFCLHLYKSIVRSSLNKQYKATKEYKAKKYHARKLYLQKANAKTSIGHTNCDPPDYKQVFETCQYTTNSFNIFSYDFIPNMIAINNLPRLTKIGPYAEFLEQDDLYGVIRITKTYRKKEKDSLIFYVRNDSCINSIIKKGGIVKNKKLNLSRVSTQLFDIYKNSLIVLNIDETVSLERLIENMEDLGSTCLASITSDSKNRNHKIAILTFFLGINEENFNNYRQIEELNQIIVQKPSPQKIYEIINTRTIDDSSTIIYPAPTHSDTVDCTEEIKSIDDNDDEEKEFEEEEEMKDECEKCEEDWNSGEITDDEENISNESDPITIDGDFADDCVNTEAIEQHFLSHESQELFNKTAPLKNPTQTLCFVNAVVQAIANIKELANVFIDNAELNFVFRNFSALLIRMINFNEDPVDPITFIRSLRKPNYFYQQQDAAEFLHTLYEKTINNLINTNISEIFSGKTTSHFSCETEDWETEPSPFITIELPIKGHISMNEALNSHFSQNEQKNIKTNEDKIEDGTVQTIVKHLPHVLIIILNRFEIFESTAIKNNQRIIFPTFLKNETWCTNVEHDYKLASVVAHKGTTEYGHYICYSYHDPIWYLYNDEITTLKDNILPESIFGDNSENNFNAYILFYKMV